MGRLKCQDTGNQKIVGSVSAKVNALSNTNNLNSTPEVLLL